MKQQRHTNGKPHLVILHPSGTLQSHPFSVPHWRQSYFDFFKTAEKQFVVYYVRGKEKHLGNGIFHDGYQYRQGKLRRVTTPIHARIVYNKNRLECNGGKEWAIVNKWKLYALTYDKYGSYRAFQQYMKPTYHVTNKTQLKRAISKIQTETVVYKPLHGLAGKGVIIGSHQYVHRAVMKANGLIQAFVDTSHGIAGLYRGRHDLRVTVMNGHIIQSFIRIPPAHLMVANVSQGARARQVPLNMIPSSAKRIVRHIDARLKQYGDRIYAVDMGFEKGKPYIFEINPEPGLPYKHWKYHYHEFHHGLVDTLLHSVPRV